MVDHDPARWSHSTGEAQQHDDRINAANQRSSGSSGVVEEATPGVNGNATDLSITVSSGQEAKDRRQRARREREERGRERQREQKREEEEKEREKIDRETRGASEKEASERGASRKK
ncbi:hypothetical protein CTA1_2959 [Colletotrichum tanaceti]|uniref:Uncharacterized protein n=1 Tax=Colletotrichum tanaceti TaxID=1306861 RepID=A0A4U6X9G3_9PEZI|nr:hypothetical protein CTA1_2959 [Colletotrichum tanaceti]